MKVVQTAQRRPFLFLQTTLRSQLRADGEWACPAVNPSRTPFQHNFNDLKSKYWKYKYFRIHLFLFKATFLKVMTWTHSAPHSSSTALPSHKYRSLENCCGRIHSWARFSPAQQGQAHLTPWMLVQPLLTASHEGDTAFAPIYSSPLYLQIFLKSS